MSHLISLCSQKCSSGRLNRVVQWLDKECKRESLEADQTLEVTLALDIAWAGHIGCASGDELSAIMTLYRISKCSKQYHDKGRIKNIQARALGCTACLLIWGRELALSDSLMTIRIHFLLRDTECSTREEMTDLTTGQSVDSLSQAATIGNSCVVFNLNTLVMNDHGSRSKKK